jgi:hypothetical protein
MNFLRIHSQVTNSQVPLTSPLRTQAVTTTIAMGEETIIVLPWGRR